MKPNTTTRLAPALPPANVEVRRFTVAEYHRLIAIGVLTEDDPVELLEGWLRYRLPEAPPRNPIHDYHLDMIRRAFDPLLPTAFSTREQKSVTLSDSEPVPDFAVVDGLPRRYVDHHPSSDEIAIIGEVADLTLDFDRIEIGRIYSREKIPVYWIVNLVDSQVEVYTDPDSTATPPVYRTRHDYPVGSSVPVVLRGQQVGTIAVQDIMP